MNNVPDALLKRVGLGVSLLLHPLSPANMSASDWPQWRGPNRDGSWTETGIVEKFPASGLAISWSVPVGRGWSSPIVTQNRVCVTDVELAAPMARERVVCFDEVTGKLLWIHQYDAGYPDWAFSPDAGGPRATPISQGGKLITLGAMGHLFCLDLVDGGVMWAKNLASEYGVKEFTGITASPLIEGDLLILYMCGKPGACVVAFDKVFRERSLESLGRFVYLQLADCFRCRREKAAHCLDARRRDLARSNNGPNLVERRIPHIRRYCRVHAGGPRQQAPDGGLMLKLRSDKPGASVLWPGDKAATARILSNTSTALLQGDYVFSAKTSGELICLDARTGNQLWQTNRVTDLKNGSSIHITPNGDSVFLFTNQGDLIRARLSPEGYHELGRAHLLDPTHPFNGRKVVWPPPAYANHRVFARNDKQLVCAWLGSEPSK